MTSTAQNEMREALQREADRILAETPDHRTEREVVAESMSHLWDTLELCPDAWRTNGRGYGGQVDSTERNMIKAARGFDPLVPPLGQTRNVRGDIEQWGCTKRIGHQLVAVIRRNVPEGTVKAPPIRFVLAEVTGQRDTFRRKTARGYDWATPEQVEEYREGVTLAQAQVDALTAKVEALPARTAKNKRNVLMASLEAAMSAAAAERATAAKWEHYPVDEWTLVGSRPFTRDKAGIADALAYYAAWVEGLATARDAATLGLVDVGAGDDDTYEAVEEAF